MMRKCLNLFLMINVLLWLGMAGCSSNNSPGGSYYSGSSAKSSNGCVTTRPTSNGRLQIVPCGTFLW